ncbi:LemA family protein [Timonella senegalensis]|uniref:LemA family protein n=1 Tax=Timonella senegalensis TaxID=1465825 RepID=UPI0002F9B840|nr:LemA family protein [Timonella senegalensis]
MEIVLVVLAFVVLAIVGWIIGTYNGFIKLRNLVQESWRQIDVELHRRHDLIPNLISTVKGYAAHERGVLEQLTNARANAAGLSGDPVRQAEAEGQVSRALSGLFAVAENYPELKASANFLELQRELANTEDRIAANRRFYNANVRDLNTKVESFPSNIIAGIFNFVRAQYFETDDPAVRAVPAVEF